MCVNLSGGRSSAYQAAHIIEADPSVLTDPDVLFVNENTGHEDELTRQFLAAFDDYFGCNTIYLEYDPAAPHKHRQVDIDAMGMAGEPFRRLLDEQILRRDGTVGIRPLSNPTMRICTANLKVKTCHRYLRKSRGWPREYYTAIGYRADEKPRYERRIKRELRTPFDEGGNGVYPMYHAGVDADRVYAFWRSMPFDLQIDSTLGNCSFCFMLSTWKIKERMMLAAIEAGVKVRPGATPPPKLAQWISYENRAHTDRPGVFRKDRPALTELWNEVCAGDMSMKTSGGRAMACGTCTD